jgi:exonuclease III
MDDTNNSAINKVGGQHRSKGINIGFLNIQSLYHKLSDLKFFLSAFSIDILCIAETWLTSEIQNSELFMNNYVIHRIDRQNKRGGGVLILVHIRFNAQLEGHVIDDNLELIHLSIDFLHSKPLQIVCFYRPPSCPVADFICSMSSYLDYVDFSNLPMALVGDINIDLLKIKSTHQVLKFFSIYGMKPLKSTATRVSKTSATQIDWIIPNQLALNLINHSCVEPVSFSDHNAIIFSYKKKRNAKKETTYSFSIQVNKLNSDILNKILVTFDPTTISELIGLINMTIPYLEKLRHKVLLKRTEHDWLSTKFINLSQKRDNALKKYLADKNEFNFEQYKKLKNKCAWLAKSDKRAYFDHILQSSKGKDPKKMWRILNSFFSQKKSGLSIILKIDSVKTGDPVVVSNSLNNYFSTIIDVLMQESGYEPVLTPNCSACSTSLPYCICHATENIPPVFYLCSDLEVQPLLSSTKFSSVDRAFVDRTISRLCPNQLSITLAHLFNRSFVNISYPEEFKIAAIVPIHKKDDKCDVSNYRPISLLPQISKVFEKVIYKRIYTFLQRSNFTFRNQFGFQRNNNTEVALLSLISTIITHLSNKKVVGVVFLDYAKAFDSISHSLLCQKLISKFGFSADDAAFLFSYLSGRTQYVICNETRSRINGIRYGVPQGSVLGPLLFLLFLDDIQDLNFCTDTSVFLFADDTVIVSFADTPADLIGKLNSELMRIHDYCVSNQLFLNISKCKFMAFHRDASNLYSNEIKLNGVDIEVVKEYRYLGFVIDNELKFATQLNNTVNKIKSCNYAIARARKFISSEYLLIMYKSLAMSHVIYSKFLFISMSEHRTAALSNSLIKSYKTVYNIQFSSEIIVPLCFDLKYITLFYAYLFLHKFMHSNFGFQLKTFIQSRPHAYHTRRHLDVFVQQSHLAVCQKSFRFLLPNLWNRLPKSLQATSDYECFRSGIQSYLSDRPFEK